MDYIDNYFNIHKLHERIAKVQLYNIYTDNRIINVIIRAS